LPGCGLPLDVSSQPALIGLYTAELQTFRAAVLGQLERWGLATPQRRRAIAAGPAAFDPPDGPHASARTHELCWRTWLLDAAPAGITLCGPAYQDTPILATNRTLRRLTGYAAAELHGRNPRLLQGPATDAAAVARLREAIAIWSPVTVVLTNHRADGSPYRSRLALQPLADRTGEIAHWVAVQTPVGDAPPDR